MCRSGEEGGLSGSSFFSRRFKPKAVEASEVKDLECTFAPSEGRLPFIATEPPSNSASELRRVPELDKSLLPQGDPGGDSDSHLLFRPPPLSPTRSRSSAIDGNANLGELDLATADLALKPKQWSV